MGQIPFRKFGGGGGGGGGRWEGGVGQRWEGGGWWAGGGGGGGVRGLWLAACRKVQDSSFSSRLCLIIWSVVKIMVRFGVLIIRRPRIFRVPKRGPDFENSPYLSYLGDLSQHVTSKSQRTQAFASAPSRKLPQPDQAYIYFPYPKPKP